MDSESVKTKVIQQVQGQYAMENGRQLIQKVNDQCFERCVPKPGSSLSSGEQTCVTQCMEKYLQAWNQVHATYNSRIQRDQQQFSS
ncbi:Tim10/DDP family zinc finger-domain-containing protein [Xylariaceae sp. FL0016]|nr:Tim10/DDP family zinc finger-domain-containing protein [Xylariaceae sp. FL0016]